MKITFLDEHRVAFTDSFYEGDSIVLGSHPVKEILFNAKWQAATTAKVTFTAPTNWVQNNLLPGKNPALAAVPYRRARYFTIRKENGKLTTLLIEELEYSPDDEDNSLVTIIGLDPRVWASRIFSSVFSSGENWTGDRSTLMRQLSERLSNSQPAGMSHQQLLPITALNTEWEPSEEQKRLGFVKLSSIDDGDPITITSPDPLPIEGSLEELHAQWSNIELYPLEAPGRDGTASPWWQWAARQRVYSDYLFSEKNGSLSINKIKSSNVVTETMAYDSQDQTQFSFGNGLDLSNPALSGPWMGIKAESYSTPEGISTATYLRSRALTGNYNNRRLSFDTTINFTEAGIEATPGMTVYMRIDNNIVRVPLDEITSHYSAEKGWNTTSAVFIETDNIDLYDPTPPTPGTSPDVQFIVNGSSFSIPTNSVNLSDPNYSWNVYVDGEAVGAFEGTAGRYSDGIPLTFSQDGEHLIKLVPLDGMYQPGWSAAWGFNLDEYGACDPSNKAKLIKVVTDDLDGRDGNCTEQFAGCINLTHAVAEGQPYGIVLRNSQYEGCISLIKAPDEFDGAVNNGDFTESWYRHRQYAGCISLTEAAKVYMPSGTVTIGDYYRAEQYADCINLVTPAKEHQASSLEIIGDNYLWRQYAGCTSIEVAADALMLDSVLEFGDSYRANQYDGCTSLRTAATESLSSSVTEIKDAFLSSQYFNCTVLENPATEVFSKSITKIGDGFRSMQYRYCQAVTASTAEELPDTVTEIGDYFRLYQYADCYNLEVAADEVMPDSVVKLGTNFRNSMFYACQNLKKAPAEAISAGLTRIDDDFRAWQFNNCSNLEEMAVELLPEALETIGVRHRFNQYSYSGVRNAEGLLAEAAMPNLIEFTVPPFDESSSYTEEEWYSFRGENFRASQFEGCWNMVHPLKEAYSPHSIRVPNNLREKQYSDCTSMILAATEVSLVVPIIDISGLRKFDVGQNYRKAQYQNCTVLDQRRINTLEFDTRPRYVDGVLIETGEWWRELQYFGTYCDNYPLMQVRYLDGKPAEAPDPEKLFDSVPDSFYGNSTSDPDMPEPDEF